MDRGFSLVEVLIASIVTTTALIGVAQLSIASIRTNHVAQAATTTTVLALQKVEQLRTLTWAFDGSGTRRSDTTTDTTTVPEASAGGLGLTPSPAGSLVREMRGYCDFLDGNGRALGGGTQAPAAAVYVRRWSIAVLANDDTLLIQVSVTPIGVPAGESAARRRPEEARVIAIKTRKSA